MSIRKVGFSIGRLQMKYGDFEALDIAKRIGADAVDFNLDGDANDYRNPDSIYSKGEDAIREYYTAVRAHAEELGLIISQTHGKLPGFRNIPEEDAALVENSRLDCLTTACLGAPTCVIHNATTIFLGPDADPKLMRQLSFDLFTQILPFARQYGVRIATETFGDATGRGCVDFFGDIREFLMAYNRVKAIGDNAAYFTICADTGHSNKATRYGNPSPADVIRMCGADVTVLHLNDNDTFTDQHKMLFTGTIDWDDVFDALDEIGYSGVYNMELALGHFGEDMVIEEAAFAIKALRHYLDRRYGD